jgi:hypothetical protein
MKTAQIKVSGKTHERRTTKVGELIAESGMMRTYEDAIEALLNSSVLVPCEMTKELQDFIDTHKDFGFTSTDEFFKESARWMKENLTRVHKLN